VSTDERISELLSVYDRQDANACDLLCDRHPADAVAFTVVEADLSAHDLTYGHLREQSSRFAAALADLGVAPGDAVAVLMGKSAELVVALLGIWRRGAVHVPLFTAFAPPAIAMRLEASGAKVVVTDADQAAKLDSLHDGQQVVVAAARRNPASCPSASSSLRTPATSRKPRPSPLAETGR
jgi:acetyl-CoA synthetase